MEMTLGKEALSIVQNCLNINRHGINHGPPTFNIFDWKLNEKLEYNIFY